MSLALPLLLLPLLLWRPILYGSSPLDAALYALFLALYVVLPGRLAYRRLAYRRLADLGPRASEDDPLHELGMGWTLGLAMQAFAFLALKSLGAEKAFPFYPLALLPLLRRARTSPVDRPAASPPIRGVEIGLLLLLVAVAAQRTVLLSAAGWWREIDPDVYFHAGNAAELRFHWPLRDPRFAGLPLNYHFFSYALPAGASLATGVEVGELALRLAATTGPVLLALQIFNAGRLFGGSPAAGLAASALVVLHADLGEAIAVLIGAGTPSWAFNSFLDRGIYYSASTSFGLVLFASLAIALRRWMRPDAPRNLRALALAGALAAMASGVKGSVMPVALAGLGATLAWTLLRRRRIDARAAVALGVLLAASAPMTWRLAAGEGSYAATMFRMAPGFIVESCAFFPIAAGWLGLQADVAPTWYRIAAVPVWILGYLGLAGIGAGFALARERARAGAAEGWILASAAAGLAAALLLGAPGFSQLFFSYNGMIGLAILAGGPVAGAFRREGGWGLAARISIWILAAATLAGGARRALDLRRTWPQRDADRPALAAAYEEGLAWIRDRTPGDAVLVSGHSWILLSVYGERRTLYETARYTPGAYDRGRGRAEGESGVPPAGGPIADRTALRNRFLAGPDAATLSEVRTLVGASVPIYVVLDAVQYRVNRDGEQWFSIDPVPATATRPALGRPEFANEALRIHRLPDPAP